MVIFCISVIASVSLYRDFFTLCLRSAIVSQIVSDDNDAPGKDLLLKLNPAGGIPLTAIFTPQMKDPIVLSSVYSSEELLRALDRATGTTTAAAR